MPRNHGLSFSACVFVAFRLSHLAHRPPLPSNMSSLRARCIGKRHNGGWLSFSRDDPFSLNVLGRSHSQRSQQDTTRTSFGHPDVLLIVLSKCLNSGHHVPAAERPWLVDYDAAKRWSVNNGRVKRDVAWFECSHLAGLSGRGIHSG